MNSDKAIERVLNEIAFDVNEQSLRDGLERIYGVGFNDGRKSIQVHRRKMVIQKNLIGQSIKLWESLAEAEHGTGIGHTDISKCCRGIRKSAGGFKWDFAETQ